MSEDTPGTVSVTVELPVEAAMRIAAAVCARRGYGPTSPEDAVAFVKTTVFELLRQETLEYEAAIAAQQARDAVYANPDDPLAFQQGQLVDPFAPIGPDGPAG